MIRQYRIIPDTARDGLLVNAVPENMEQLTGIFSHAPMDRVAKIRIGGPGAEKFENSSELVWKEDRSYPIPFRPGVRISLDGVKKSAEPGNAAIDVLNAYRYPLPPVMTVESNADESIDLSGWAIDEKVKGVAAAVFVTVDDRTDILATYGHDRSDIAASFKNPDYRASGFRATILMEDLSKGTHTISMKILAKDGNEYYVPAQKITIEVR